VSLVRPAKGRTPTFVALPEVPKDDAVNEYPGQGAGMLGNAHGPFRIDTNDANMPCMILRRERVGQDKRHVRVELWGRRYHRA